MKNIAIIIPALNPGERLLRLVSELRDISPDMQIVIVDDGSDPACGHIFDRLKYIYGCILCRHPENYGKGAAIKTGIGHMTRYHLNCAGFITADADGQHLPLDILKVAKALRQHPDCLILGTRDFTQKQVPFKSRLGNRITARVFRLAAGTDFPDTQTGLRGIPARYAGLALEVLGERFEYEMSFLMAAAQSRIPFMHVPVGAVCIDGNHSSHFRPVRDSIRICSVILKHLLRPPAGQRAEHANAALTSASPQYKEKAVS